jgi:hypothetical protein
MTKFSTALCVFFLFALTGFCQNNNYNAEHIFSVNELKTDFQFLRTTLEKTHPDLYLYTPKPEFDLFFDSLYKSITKPLTEMEFYDLITLLNPKICDGHTMFLPGEGATAYYNREGKFFPFYVAIINNKLYVNMNCSSDTSITDGAELLSINGIKTANIIKQLLVRQIRDGNNKTYPTWILTNYFKEYFSFVFAHPDSFSITYKTGNVERQTRVNALSKDSIKYYRQAKYSNRFLSANEQRGIDLKINKQQNVATLVIKSFDDDLLRSVYGQEFDNTIKKIFIQIDAAHIDNLILDVRNNQGGDFEPGQLLLSYLLREPVKYLFNSNEATTISPQKNSFKGNLFILINGGSFSSTAILCSYLELTNRGVFIGDETAGNKVIISGDPIDTTLPNTGILCEISTVKYVIQNSNNTGHGIIPAYYRTATIKDIISNKDPAMESALKLAQKK